MASSILVNGVPYSVDATRLYDVAYLIDVHRQVGGPLTLQEPHYNIQTPFWSAVYYNNLMIPSMYCFQQPSFVFNPFIRGNIPNLCDNTNLTSHDTKPLRRRFNSVIDTRYKVIKSREQKLSQKRTDWLFIGNIPFKCTQKKVNKLLQFFSLYGIIKQVVCRIEEGRIWIQYKTIESALEALKHMDQKVFEKRLLFVDFSQAPERNTAKTRSMSVIIQA